MLDEVEIELGASDIDEKCSTERSFHTLVPDVEDKEDALHPPTKD